MGTDLRSMLKNISSPPSHDKKNKFPIDNQYKPVEIESILKGKWHDNVNQYSNWNVTLKNMTKFTIKDVEIQIDCQVVNHYHIDLNCSDERISLSIPEWKKITGGLKAKESYQFGIVVCGNDPNFNLIRID